VIDYEPIVVARCL